MSLISDALAKAQLDRAAHPGSRYPGGTPDHFTSRRRERSTRRAFIAANVVAVGSLGVATYLYLQSVAPSEKSAAVVAATPEMVAPPSAPAPTVVAPEPVAPVAPAIVVPKPTTEYELAGMTEVGPNTLLSISRRSDHRSIWIPVGKTVGEITAVSYDPQTDRAVISVSGQRLSVRLRDGGGFGPTPSQPAE